MAAAAERPEPTVTVPGQLPPAGASATGTREDSAR